MTSGRRPEDVIAELAAEVAALTLRADAAEASDATHAEALAAAEAQVAALTRERDESRQELAVLVRAAAVNMAQLVPGMLQEHRAVQQERDGLAARLREAMTMYDGGGFYGDNVDRWAMNVAFTLARKAGNRPGGEREGTDG